MTRTAPAPNQYVDRNGNVRTRAIRHSLAVAKPSGAKTCTCPSDCNCRNPWRTNYCGCKAH